jgi:ribonuclease PH
MRKEGRKNDELRKIEIIPNYLKFAQGSVLIKFGNTAMLCSANIEDKVPSFLKNSDQGWIKAEYSMLPASTMVRTQREFGTLRHGRSVEIQRLIGRSLRSAIDLKQLKEKTVIVDCDALQADGGTRTASITGGYVAIMLALRKSNLENIAFRRQIASVSVSIVNGEPLLDPDYDEDSSAEVDFNLVMDTSGNIIEIQGTGEKRSYTRDELNKMIDYGYKGITELFRVQDEALK